MLAGEEAAWQKLEARDPYEAAEAADGEYWEDDDVLVVSVFGQAYLVDTAGREIREIGIHEFHLEDTTHLNLLVPLYLASCKPLPPSGRLVKPEALPGGQSFFKGPHELPLEVIAHHFCSTPERFLEVGEKLCGTRTDGGDAAVVIPVFSKVPVTALLWLGDLEFPARAQLLLDATAQSQMPLDALWATMVMTSQAMIQLAGPHH
jgi:hypothetical protein